MREPMRVHVAKQSITRVMKAERRKNGGVAQLGEHLPCKQGVMGSNPIISTINPLNEMGS